MCRGLSGLAYRSEWRPVPPLGSESSVLSPLYLLGPLLALVVLVQVLSDTIPETG